MTMLDPAELNRLLKAIGKEAYVEILFPAMMEDKEISIIELSSKYPKFGLYSPCAQNTRRSKARKIFENGWQFVALEAIILSKRVTSEVRSKAQELKLQYT